MVVKRDHSAKELPRVSSARKKRWTYPGFEVVELGCECTAYAGADSADAVLM